MTPREVLDNELNILMDASYGLAAFTFYKKVDFLFRWTSDQMIVIRLFKDARLIDEFSYKIVTMDDVNDFRKVFGDKIRRYSEND